MIGTGPRSSRIAPPPQIRDLAQLAQPSARPEPRLRHKHALNPPIVTVIGAGVAGLTAAHELVERGFIVQVVEAQEDVYSPGRPLVGGVAANQRARVRALNPADLHPDVLQRSLQDDDAGAVARWLLELFSLNRSRWLSTEQPKRVHRTLFNAPPAAGEHTPFSSSLLKSLSEARAAYRERWLWDLVVRGAMLGAVRFPIGAEQLHGELVAIESTAALARRLLQLGAFPGSAGDAAPSPAALESFLPDLVVPALEREFLCFRLLPYARRGYEGSCDRARELYRTWSRFFADRLPHCCVSVADDAPIRVNETDAAAELPGEPVAWLHLDVIEQRLPGEHGYRFFPSFYHHLSDTMKRIPLKIDGQSTGRAVYDNLKPTVFQGMGFSQSDREEIAQLGGHVTDGQHAARAGSEALVVELHRNRPRSLEGLRDRTERFVRRIGGTRRDSVLLLAKLVRFMTSSSERRRLEYEQVSWAEFLEVQQFSPVMQRHIQSASQALLAFSASEADARTYGNVALQMLLDQLDDGTRVDRTLNGPTSDAWLEPWREHLERSGVRFFTRRLARLELTDEHGLVPVFEPQPDKTPEQLLSQNGYRLLTHEQPWDGLCPDFYVLALNLEQSLELISKLPVDPERAPDFQALLQFGEDVQKQQALKTMTGAQFFFDAKTSIGRGHMYFPFAPWGLSSISQSEFWSARGGFADGYFGVLSVDVCETGKEDGRDQGSFWQLLKTGASPEGIGDEHARRLLVVQEVWRQIAARISHKDEMAEPRSFHLDDLVSAHGNCAKYLACVKSLDEHRPGRNQPYRAGEDEIRYRLNYERWVLCGAYMATHTRMTTMESANESARHAARAILRRLTMDDSVEQLEGTGSALENARNRTYNGASPRRVYDLPDIWNLEHMELEDLDLFRRVDRRLVALGLGHFMDIIDFDAKLQHALQAQDLYGGEQSLGDLLGATVAGMDALLSKELGRGYDARLGDRVRAARDAVAGLTGDQPEPIFQDMRGLLDRLRGLLDTLAR